MLAQATDAAPPVGDLPDKLASQASASLRDTLFEMWRDFIGHLPLIGIAVLILLITWALAALVNYLANRSLQHTRMRESLRQLFARLLYIAVWVVGITVAAMIVFPGLTPSKALAALGLGSIAVGFAFKDIFENFFAGILILWRFPFENGDFIEINGITGKVEDVTIRNTLLRQVTGELVVIPNATIFNNPVYVLTNWPMRRVTVITGVAYGEDVDAARTVLEEALARCQSPRKERPVEIFAQEFADSSINFEVTWWCNPTPKDVRASRDEVVAAVKRALDDAGIEIPFPYRTLTFKEPLRTIGERVPDSGRDADT